MSQSNNFSFSNFYNRYAAAVKKSVQDRTTNRVIWVALTVFTITFFALAAIRPTLLTIAKLVKEIREQTETSQKLQTKINAIVAAQEEFAKNADSFPLLDQALPEKTEFNNLVFFLEDAASSSGSQLSSFSFTKINEIITTEQIQPKVEALSFSVGINGKYENLDSFLKKLESSRRIISIDEATYGQSSDVQTGLSLQISGKASYLIKKLDKESGK